MLVPLTTGSMVIVTIEVSSGSPCGSPQDFLRLTGACEYPPLQTANTHQVTSRKQGNVNVNVNVLMGRLADQGVVYRLQKVSTNTLHQSFTSI